MKLINSKTNIVEDIPDNVVGDALLTGLYNITPDVSTVHMYDQTHSRGVVPANQLIDALKEGYTIVPSEELRYEELQTRHGGVAGQAAAAGLGLMSGLSFGLADQAIARISPDTMSNIRDIKEANPNAALLGEIASVAAPSGLPGGIGKLVEGARLAGRGSAKLAGNLAETLVPKIITNTTAQKVLNKAVSEGVGNAVEGALYGAGYALSEDALSNPDFSAESLANTAINASKGAGMGALFGGGIGAAMGAGGVGVGLLSEATLNKLNKWSGSTKAGETVVGGFNTESSLAPKKSTSLIQQIKESLREPFQPQAMEMRRILTSPEVTEKGKFALGKNVADDVAAWDDAMGSLNDDVDREIKRIHKESDGIDETKLAGALRKGLAHVNDVEAKAAEKQLMSDFNAAFAAAKGNVAETRLMLQQAGGLIDDEFRDAISDAMLQKTKDRKLADAMAEKYVDLYSSAFKSVMDDDALWGTQYTKELSELMFISEKLKQNRLTIRSILHGDKKQYNTLQKSLKELYTTHDPSKEYTKLLLHELDDKSIKKLSEAFDVIDGTNWDVEDVISTMQNLQLKEKLENVIVSDVVDYAKLSSRGQANIEVMKTVMERGGTPLNEKFGSTSEILLSRLGRAAFGGGVANVFGGPIATGVGAMVGGMIPSKILTLNRTTPARVLSFLEKHSNPQKLSELVDNFWKGTKTRNVATKSAIVLEAMPDKNEDVQKAFKRINNDLIDIKNGKMFSKMPTQILFEAAPKTANKYIENVNRIIGAVEKRRPQPVMIAKDGQPKYNNVDMLAFVELTKAIANPEDAIQQLLSPQLLSADVVQALDEAYPQMMKQLRLNLMRTMSENTDVETKQWMEQSLNLLGLAETSSQLKPKPSVQAEPQSGNLKSDIENEMTEGERLSQ